VDASGFLNNLVNYEQVPGYDYDLKGYRAFLAHFNDPHHRVSNVIQIAGTKGKGSVAALLHSCLSACGYRVGLFTSPHLATVHERIRINNGAIKESELLRYIARIEPFVRKHHQARTYFEVLTTIALLHFHEHNTDFTILETGLGGRIDSTSVTRPISTVITRIGYDHQHLLGNRLQDIAWEKAGIIRNNIEVITVRQRPTVHRVLARVARQKDTRLVFSDTFHSIDPVRVTARGTKVHVNGHFGRFTVHMPLVGRHHAENLSLCLAVLSALRHAGHAITLPGVTQGIINTQLRGRFEVVSENPRIIYDCAHNTDSYKALDNTLHDIGIKDFRLVFGTSEHKDFSYCLKHIAPRAKEILLVQADHPRALRPELLARQFRRHNSTIVIAGSMKNALAYVHARPRTVQSTIITGSFYLWQSAWRN
jgi:dihydrofolate synthase/folylpolyglutamate synthase